MPEDVTSSRAKRSGPPTYAGSLRESNNIREFGRCQHLGNPPNGGSEWGSGGRSLAGSISLLRRVGDRN